MGKEMFTDFPDTITYGRLRAVAVADVMMFGDEVSRLRLSLKFAHNPNTALTSYGYIAANPIAVEAIETIQTAALAAER